MDEQNIAKAEKVLIQPTTTTWWKPLHEFAVHATVGTLIFVIIAIPALLLNVCINWLSSRNFSPIVIYGLELAEYTLFGVDLLLFIIFLARAAWRTIRRF